MSVIPPKLASRASPQGAGAALGRPGGGANPPKLASRASPGGLRALGAARRARAFPPKRASLGEAV
jgi:hypothetical protein